MGKGWSVFFGAVLTATFLLWIAAPAMGWWLPENVASFGGEVDYLFYVILGLTGFFFVLTEALLVYAMWRYAYRPGAKSDYVEGNHRLELAWTIVPAGILLFIAFAQIGAWERIKYGTRMPPPHQIVQVTARQWEWRLRYPSDADRFNAAGKSEKDARLIGDRARRWAELPEMDDLHTVNELHAWKGGKVKIFLKTLDVLHSFGIPTLRLMQDALPGKTIPMWFEATDSNTRREGNSWKLVSGKEWEIACKELCGNGHYRMRGLLFVHPDYEDYKRWLAHEVELQRSRKAEDVGVAANVGP